MKTTYTINNPTVERTRYGSLSSEKQLLNAEARSNSELAFLEFVKDTLEFYEKKWTFEEKRSEVIYNKRFDIIINGHSLDFSFKEFYITVCNTAYGDNKSKTNIYYDKQLTLKDHGAKLIKIIESQHEKIASQKRKSDNKKSNENLSKEAFEYLIKNHFSFKSDTEKDCWKSSFNENQLILEFKFEKARCEFHFNTEPNLFGKVTMVIKDYFMSYDHLEGKFSINDLNKRMEHISSIVKTLEEQFQYISNIWAAAVAKIQENNTQPA